ncbi:tripartite-type tricarboxylate transporter receptor subunit TctC [Rhodoferax ferrireducens]|uniref:Tripartite-type tricarboxylate transporter receptor subunit TctC n=1 Tax=Rhodoferax ferrireducens TaxID=192843 RepID=A0ABU2C591_9BURK|nr:tripartite tricarboxylate transporter substrate binding protein [Rhodoferax ferrireducens]MDR7376493.1 tripartite-type tricarboxylate transporter receptor subunit TctC [Rhodoferax ferrireducens]
MKKPFQLSLALVAASLALLSSPASAEDAYPSKPIRLVVTYPPGGSNDMVARIVGQKLAVSLGQPVLVDNKPGASGNIGMDFVAKAPKDGYTLLLAHTGLASNAHLFAKMPFDPLKDIAPIIRIADQPNVLIVNPKWPFKNVAELVAYAKANPGKLSVGTSGLGGPQDVAARRFMQMTGTDMLNVAYKGGAPALADLLGGQIDLMFETSPTAVPYAKSGKLKALAVTSDKRLSTLADVPTVAEAGVAGYKSIGWVGLAAPAGTPPAIIAKLNEQVQLLLNTSEMKKQITDISLDVTGSSVAGFNTFVRKEWDDYAKFVKDSNITPQ